MSKKKWTTAITDASGGKVRLRGYDLNQIMGRLSFSEAIFLLLKGELPDEKEKLMMEALFVSSIDHGIGPPSAVAARTVFSGGNPLNTAVAAGVMTIGESHGGAIEKCAQILQEYSKDMTSAKERAKELVAEFRREKKRMPGYGHKIYAKDPRTVRLLEIAKDIGYSGKIIDLAVEVENELKVVLGRDMPLNVDGAIAAIISEMGFDWKLGKGFFIIARTPGLVAQVYEEWMREKPMSRRLSSEEYGYDGAAPRDLAR